ncbi:FKBP-type peptidyl-prolyl cis-trans isomerase [Sanguibacter antarcticus]|nr:FKBP-type peptidyl-prolyl cis-trans isomerase [Sanguibacter antarcticus]
MTALTLGAALLLSACGADAESEATPSESATDAAATEPTPTAEDIAAVDAVTLTGDPGTKPTLEFATPLTTSAPVIRLIDEGTGEEILAGSLVGLQSVSYTGTDGVESQSTWETEPGEITIGDPGIVATLSTALEGQKVGARFILANMDQNGETQVIAIEAVSTRTIPSRAEGEAVAPVDGLPTVTLDDTGKPSIEVPDGYTAPAELVTQPLITGAGAPVEAGQSVTFQYSGWKVSDGTLFDSSWENGSAFTTTIGTGSVIPGWDQGLVGQTVGSQVLLVIPKSLAYEGQESDLADEDLIFVVDILDAK